MAATAHRRRQQLASQRARAGNPEPVPLVQYRHSAPCTCGALLSAYNPGPLCSPCERRRHGFA